MGSRSRGIRASSAPHRAAHSSMTTENPAQMPKLKGRARRKPKRLPLPMDMRVLGPGVPAVTKT